MKTTQPPLILALVSANPPRPSRSSIIIPHSSFCTPPLNRHRIVGRTLRITKAAAITRFPHNLMSEVDLQKRDLPIRNPQSPIRNRHPPLNRQKKRRGVPY